MGGWTGGWSVASGLVRAHVNLFPVLCTLPTILNAAVSANLPFISVYLPGASAFSALALWLANPPAHIHANTMYFTRQRVAHMPW